MLWFSLPTIGATSVSISARIRCILGAMAFIFTPYFEPCFIISGFSSCISSRDGVTTPYPFRLTSSSAYLILSYSFFAEARTLIVDISS